MRLNRADLTSPIVCVSKKVGSLRICGDFKVSVNQVLETTVTRCWTRKIYLQHYEVEVCSARLICQMPISKWN